MATKFIIRHLCSIFYRHSAKKKKSHSSRTVNRVFGHWATSTADDVPPPYTDSPETKTYSQDEKHSPPPQFTSPRLQLCSHESLSFEELQKIATSLAINSTDQPVNALTPNCHAHRSQSTPATVNSNSVCCVSSPGLLRGSGTYALEDRKDPSHDPSVILGFHWDLGYLDGIRSQVQTAAELQLFMAADAIRLCPHKWICDSDVVNAIYAFVQKPSRCEVTTGCDHCNTKIKVSVKMEGSDETCRVTTQRYLGTAEKPNDPMWLAQCGV